MTGEYKYQAFATYLILEEYPELVSYASYKSPASNDKYIIANEYTKLVEGAKTENIDISNVAPLSA